MDGTHINRTAVIDLICQAARDVAAGARYSVPGPMGEHTRLFGSHGFLDSLSLVSVVLDVEQLVNDGYGLSISLADDRSVSQERSPFRSVASLADYVLMLAGERKQG